MIIRNITYILLVIVFVNCQEYRHHGIKYEGYYLGQNIDTLWNVVNENQETHKLQAEKTNTLDKNCSPKYSY